MRISSRFATRLGPDPDADLSFTPERSLSGLVAVWQLDGLPLTDGLLERLMAPIAHRGPDGLHWWRPGPMAIGCAQFKVTPESADEVVPLVADTGAVLTWDGRLDNRTELLSELASSAQVDAMSPDAILVMA